MLATLAMTLAVPQVATWEGAVKQKGTAANYRNLADAYVQSKQFQKASEAFAKASVLYAKLGDPNAAKVLDLQARRYRTEIRLFAEVETTPGDARANYTGMRNEPMVGCYIGANVEREDNARDPARFNELTRRHAMFFMYRKYGVAFPKEYAQQLRDLGAGLQIAFEPTHLDEVQDDDYLRQFATDAYASGIPIFLRFASEMNGDWVRYGQDPVAYKDKFRMVARVVREIAPNVAMVWCPSASPEAKIAQYYPGADAVDWVGVNFYSVLYNDADRARVAEWQHPIDAIDYVYRTYARTHPMMVGEWAATHRSVLDSANRPDFARTRIGQFYSALPRMYPRLKAVNWLSMNTLQHARTERQLNNYSLLDEPTVGDKYRRMVNHCYFLDQMRGTLQSSPTRFIPIRDGMILPAGTRVTAFVRSYEPNPVVLANVDGKEVLRATEPSPYEVELPWRAGATTVEYTARDGAGRVAGKTRLKIVLQS
jgi:hypothetical protein